jgi:hypothetical protein
MHPRFESDPAFVHDSFVHPTPLLSTTLNVPMEVT